MGIQLMPWNNNDKLLPRPTENYYHHQPSQMNKQGDTRTADQFPGVMAAPATSQPPQPPQQQRQPEQAQITPTTSRRESAVSPGSTLPPLDPHLYSTSISTDLKPRRSTEPSTIYNATTTTGTLGSPATQNSVQPPTIPVIGARKGSAGITLPPISSIASAPTVAVANVASGPSAATSTAAAIPIPTDSSPRSEPRSRINSFNQPQYSSSVPTVPSVQQQQQQQQPAPPQAYAIHHSHTSPPQFQTHMYAQPQQRQHEHAPAYVYPNPGSSISSSYAYQQQAQQHHPQAQAHYQQQPQYQPQEMHYRYSTSAAPIQHQQHQMEYAPPPPGVHQYGHPHPQQQQHAVQGPPPPGALVYHAHHQHPQLPHFAAGGGLTYTGHAVGGDPHMVLHAHGATNGVGAGGPMSAPEMEAMLTKKIPRRRTRTGCLTCRKRRIKCDERKPHCLNCEKSRKVCLGYEQPPFQNRKGRYGQSQGSGHMMSRRSPDRNLEENENENGNPNANGNGEETKRSLGVAN